VSLQAKTNDFAKSLFLQEYDGEIQEFRAESVELGDAHRLPLLRSDDEDRANADSIFAPRGKPGTDCQLSDSGSALTRKT
jgi:hypothetical protein